MKFYRTGKTFEFILGLCIRRINLGEKGSKAFEIARNIVIFIAMKDTMKL